MNRQLRIIFVNGRAAHFTFRELLELHLHPVSLGMLILSFLVFHFAVPMPLIGTMLPVYKTVLWAKLIALLYITYFLAVWVMRDRVIISPLVLGAAAAVLTLASRLFIEATLGVQLPLAELVFVAIAVWVVCLLMEMAFVVMIGRDALREAQASQAPRAAAEGAELVIASERLDARRIRYITSEEHYLRIVMADRTLHVRGRIADVEAQLPPSLGLRVHRSHWVARSAIKGVERADPSVRLVLTCGARVPVARGRQGTVRNWIGGAQAA